MTESLLLVGVVILISILSTKYIDKLPVPSLLIFIILGMFFGENGIFRISFNDYQAVNAICCVCLIFIMFYGGFGTNLKMAKQVVLKACLLSSFGVIITAFLVGIFAHYFFNISIQEGLLIGSVISSTDAASVFHILKSKKLALKYHTDSLLEIESGSNDPMSYMLTTIMIAIMMGKNISIPNLLLTQLLFGLLFGFLISKFGLYIMGKDIIDSKQGKTVFLFSLVILAYALTDFLNGNGYLAVYIFGIIIGNSNLSNKKYLIHFFDVITNVSQVVIFFLLGLLVTPIKLPALMIPALLLTAFLSFVARPLAVFGLLMFFKTKLKALFMISFAGLRGVASIVFAIAIFLNNIETKYNLFNLVFCIVIISIVIQGTFLPNAAKFFNMIDENEDIYKTFNDYQEDSDISFIKIHLDKNHHWCNKSLSEIALTQELLVVLVVRKNENIIPDGQTILRSGDLVVMAAKMFEDRKNLVLMEYFVENKHKYVDKKLYEIPKVENELIILIKRGKENIIPKGNTIIRQDDVLVFAKMEND